MFNSGWLESLNIYVVENIVHSAMAAGIVWLALVLLKIREPALRIKLLLIALLLPIFTPVLFYLLFPQRQEMSVLPLDKVFELKSAFDDPSLWAAVSQVMTIALIVTAAFLILKGAVSIVAILWLHKRFPQVDKVDNSRLDAIVEATAAKATIQKTGVLLSSSRELICCSFGVVKPYLLISRGFLQRLSNSEIQAAVAHEMAHIQRRDRWMCLLLDTLRHILFFNPVVHMVSRRLRLELEMAADDMALGRGLDRLSYAQTLVSVSRLSMGRRVSQLASNSFSAGALALRKRVDHALDRDSLPAHGFQRIMPVPMGASLLVALFFLC